MSTCCTALHHLLQRLPLHNFPFDTKKIPLDGIYILFEAGELSHGTNRIVRVGTHTGNRQLRSRLNQHFISENKDRSIFRKNIGRAILNKTGDPFLTHWDLDLTTRKIKEKYAHTIDPYKQKIIEQQVTSYIQGSFRFAVLPVIDKKRRLELESKMISTVSLCEECFRSNKWLGSQSPKLKIRESGLWLVNELYKEPLSEVDLVKLERLLIQSE